MVDLVKYIYWTPNSCRWNKEQPPQFTIWLNILYACAGGFTAANLYYSHPILSLLSQDFDVTEAKVSSIPALALAGDTTGLLFILPLADYFPRRRFTLTLVFLSAAFWLGLCLTTNFNIFLVLTYLSALFTGVCQIMLPLVSELSTPESRAFSLSIVGAGPTLAILLARILSGIVANYTAWRNIYWLALGLQISVLTFLWMFMPDYPPINKTRPRDVAKTYPKIIWSILVLYTKYPILVQTASLAFCTFFTVSSYWTTLSFLLSGSPYHYSTMIIGLFGLVGAATMVIGPIYAKYIIQPLKEPLYSVAIGKTISLTGIVVGTFVGRYDVAGPVIQALLLDAGLMIVSISNRMSLHPVAPLSRNRVNTAYTAMLYLGQFIGTKAGTEIYASHGGWLASGGLSIGIIVLSYALILLRGPNETRWVGWRGGWHPKHEDEAELRDEESVQPVDEKASNVEAPKTEEG